MSGTNSDVLGRHQETIQVGRFISRVPDGPSGLLLEGEAGIGKTTLWREASNRALGSGYGVLTTRPVEAEAGFSYAALADLLEDVLDGALPDLPAPQRRALEVALLRADAKGVPPDQYAVSMAALGVVRSLAASGPVVIAIDDVHWIDPSSARVLGFAIRRLTNERVGILASARTGLQIPVELANALPAALVRRVHVGPMGVADVAALIRQHLRSDLPRPLVTRLHEVSAGNPFYVLEIARALLREGASPNPAAPLPVPENLQQLLGARIAALPVSAARALLPIAAATRPTEDLVLAAAVGRRDQAVSGLVKAEEAGIIQRDGGRIRFTHPLLGSTVYAAATPQARRELHGRLSELTTDPEERARHLALSTTKPDREVARVLEEAARHARARGAPDAAAELGELAVHLTPTEDEGETRRRRLGAAEYHFDAGDAMRAIAMLDEAIEASPPGPGRAEILFHLSSMSWMNLERGVRAPLVRALPEALGDDGLLSGIHQGIAWVDMYQGELPAAAEHARLSVAHAGGNVEAATRADALATFSMVEFLMGRSAGNELTEALELQDVGMEAGSWTEASVYTTPRSILGLQTMWAGDLDAARALFEHELAEYESHSMYTVRQEVLCYLAELECRAGRWRTAADHAAEAMETVIESGQTATQSHVALFNQAYAAAHLGQAARAQEMATDGLRGALANDDTFNANWNRAVLGFLALSRSDYEQAHEHLEPVVRYLGRMSPAEPSVIPCIPDEIETLVLLGRVEEADEALAGFTGRARSMDRPWALATAARCRGLIAGARGDPSAALRSLEDSLFEHARLTQPFELARTLLVKGEVERRAKQKRSARADLERALRIFESLGAPLWAKRARSELVRAGGASAPTGALTPTEQRIAELAMEGRTNRQVADELFVSVKTVEANLSRVYQKLGIASRRDLARMLRPGEENRGPSPS